MNQTQVNTLRNQINAAHRAGDLVKADALQAKLHTHFTAQADKFCKSEAGAAHAAYLMGRP